ncbi:transposable element Tcb2 transposase [Trichonephila clavipes]|nr:transposable element Tcb2 transposase [Trichonephila clavipes]
MVYAGISIDGCPTFHIIQNGALTGHQYRDEIFRPIVVSYVGEIGDGIMSLNDNRRPHCAFVKDFFFEEGIIRMECPVCSLDLNPIDQCFPIFFATNRSMFDNFTEAH